MDISGERSADSQRVGASLLLSNGPGMRGSYLHSLQRINKLRPLYSRFYLANAALGIQAEILSTLLGAIDD